MAFAGSLLDDEFTLHILSSVVARSSEVITFSIFSYDHSQIHYVDVKVAILAEGSALTLVGKLLRCIEFFGDTYLAQGYHISHTDQHHLQSHLVHKVAHYEESYCSVASGSNIIVAVRIVFD